MIKFDINKLTVQYVRAKRITTALGGSITIIDESITDKEVLRRIEIPYGVARHFVKRNKGKSQYVVPARCCIIWYDDLVVHVEKLRNITFNELEQDWTATSKYAIDRIIKPMVTTGDSERDNSWYTDGVILYQLPENAWNHDQHRKLTQDGKFRGVSVKAIKFKHLADLALIENTTTMSLVSFLPTGKRKPTLSAPIWTNVFDSTKFKSDETDNCRFDAIEQQYFVNLNFVLAAGTKIGRTFGYDEVEPLSLDQLMINLNTVNLPKVANSIRQSYDTHQRFTVMLAWLLGFQSRCKTLHEFSVLRSLIKYLSTRGIYEHSKLSYATKVDLPPQVDYDQALQHVKATVDHVKLKSYFFGGYKDLEDHDMVPANIGTITVDND